MITVRTLAIELVDSLVLAHADTEADSAVFVVDGKPELRGERNMRHVLVVVAMAASLGCTAHSGSVIQEPDSERPLSITQVPQELGTFRVSETHRYPDPQAGTLYRFRNNTELRPDVYVYPVPTGRGAVPLNPAREEGMNFGRVLTAQQRQRSFESFEIVGQRPLEHTVRSSVIPGWHSHAVLTRRGEKRDSHMHLFVIGDRMLKVRTTFPQGSVDAAELERFISMLVADMTQEPGRQ